MQYRRSIFTLALAISLLLGIQPATTNPFFSAAGATQEYGNSNSDSNQLETAMHLAAGYLSRSCGDTGKFMYRINLNPAIQPKPRYNFLRHAGAIYAMAAYDLIFPQTVTKNAVERASAYLKNTAISSLTEKKDSLAVWSHPEITGSNKPLQAKLGGAGLGLIALLQVERILPGTTPLSYLRRLGNFILFMQKSDGSFYSKYIPEKGGRDDSWTSLYYPGEAALGLLMLYEIDPSKTWLQAAANSIAYLARIRKGKRRVEADHWALLATAKLLPLYDRCRQPVPKQAIESHAIQICESILKGKPESYGDLLSYGCLTDDGRTTPTAIRLEGMLGIYDVLPVKYDNLRKRMLAAIDQGIQFLLRSQLRSGDYTGGIPRAIHKLPGSHPQFSKSYNRRATEVRIDYVQHALSAMLQYKPICTRNKNCGFKPR